MKRTLQVGPLLQMLAQDKHHVPSKSKRIQRLPTCTGNCTGEQASSQGNVCLQMRKAGTGTTSTTCQAIAYWVPRTSTRGEWSSKAECVKGIVCSRVSVSVSI